MEEASLIVIQLLMFLDILKYNVNLGEMFRRSVAVLGQIYIIEMARLINERLDQMSHPASSLLNSSPPSN